MADVVFVTPNFGGWVKDEPVGTLLLATIVRNANIPVEVLQFRHFGDADHFDCFISSAVDKILAKNPRIVSFYTRCDTYHISIKIAQCLKQLRKDIYIVYGGPQADLSAEDTLREIPQVDYVCCGEGENTIIYKILCFRRLLPSFATQNPPSSRRKAKYEYFSAGEGLAPPEKRACLVS